MNKNIESTILKDLFERIPALRVCQKDIEKAFKVLVDCFEGGNKLLIAGNGGSSSDAEHIAGELMKSFNKRRPLKSETTDALECVNKDIADELSTKLEEGLPTIVLANHQGLNTAFINDVDNGGKYLFSQQLNVYGKRGDVLLAISTSGKSKNVVLASCLAKAKGMKIIELTGESGGAIEEYADVVIKAPASKTHIIQEYHLPIYHALCLMLEEYFFYR